MKPVIVGIGEFLWDIFPNGRQLGGAPANSAYHVTALGGQGILVSQIGADEMGVEILKWLRKLSLNWKYIGVDRNHPTGRVLVKGEIDSSPQYIISEHVAWDYIPTTSQLKRLAGKIDAVIFGTLAQRSSVSRTTIRSFIKCTPENVLCIFDANLRQPFYSREIIEWSLTKCHVLKLNNEELNTLAEMFSLEGNEIQLLADLLVRFQLRLIALTKGAKGSILYSSEGISVHSGYKTEVVSTVGAGDAFTAVLALGILQNWGLDDINDHANQVAAYVCTKPGATPPIPADFTIEQYLSQKKYVQL